ncbi:hypothetical protein Ddye_012576 [Dipteronia dyeriana]|uniref:Uncharacterized protein n=1 Tax=Dipteronia dyeriana TaxID=168575 RepID=A0AAE0CIT5_9ROSI|nr:hypothetical protein Ddye_012576 [Dipteronia dyeriana]
MHRGPVVLNKGSEQNGKILGFRCCKGEPLISHIFFTDDNILLCTTSLQSGQEIKKLLGISFSPNVDETTRRGYQNLLEFWRGSSEGKKKINWVSADKVCLPKGCGGLGFKILVFFNQALLVKQAWRLLQNKVLKAKYFKQEDFLYTCLCPGNSSTWRSICWGRDLLWKGLRLRVGNGQTIRAFVDPWLPRPITFRPISKDPTENIRVEWFTDNECRCWDFQKLNHFFMDFDRELILSIPISIKDRRDLIAWHFDKKMMLYIQERLQGGSLKTR